MHSSYESEPVGIERQGLPNGCPAQERFHHRLIQCVPNVILFLSLDHLILEFNPEAEQLYGRKREDVLGKNYIEEFLPEDARQAVAADIEKVLAGEPKRNFVNTIIAHDGLEHILSWNVERVLDSDNNPIGVIAVGRDITECEKAEKTLKQYELIVESAHDAIFFKDRLSRYIIANDKTLESFGLSREQVIGNSDYEIMPDKEQARQNIENDQVVFEAGKPKEFIKEMTSANGVKLWFQAIKVPQFNESGDVIGLIGIARDVTEHNRTDQALRISEQQYRTTLNSMQDAIHVVDADLRVVLMNDRFLQWLDELDIEIHNPIGHSIPEIFPFLPDKVCDEYRHVFEYGEILTTEDTIKVADRHIATNTRKIPVYKADKIVQVVTIIRDITENKRAEEALRESEEKYRTLFESANDAIFALQVDGSNLSFKECNSHTMEMFKCRKEDIIGKSPVDFSPSFQPDGTISKERAAELCSAAVAGEPQRFEWKHCRFDGAEFDAEVTLNRVDIAGETCLQAIVRDVSERKQSEEALQESENRYRSVVENAREGIIVAQDGMLRLVNSHQKSITGRSQEESMSRPFIEFVHPDDRERLTEIHSKRLKGEEVPQLYEFRAIHKQGHTIWLENNGILIEWNGKPASLNFLRDITDRKKSEEALQKSESMYRMLVESTNSFVFSLDPDGNFCFVNRFWTDKLGYSSEEIVGKNGFDLIVPESIEAVREKFAEVLKGNIIEDIEFRSRTKNKGFIDVTVNLAPICDSSGKVIRMLGTGIDITERKQAQEKMRESEARYRALIESQVDLVSRYRPDTTLTFVNDAYCQFYGKTRDELIGQSFLSMVAPESHELILKEIENMVKDPRPIVGEYLNYRQDGEECWIQWVIQGIEDENGRVVELQAVGRDIADRKRAEETLRASEERLKILFESAPDAYYIHDLEGNFIDGNKAAEELVGYEKEEAIGKSMFELGMITEVDVPKVIAAITANREGKPAGPQELLLNHKNGSKVMVETRSYPVDIAGEMLILGIARDITDRKKTEAALAESERKFRKFFEKEPEYCYMISPEGAILEANYAALNTLGYTMEELAGKPVATIYAPESYQKMHQLITQWEQTGEIRNEEMVILTKNGEKRTVLLSAAQVWDGDGKPLHRISIQRDITERKQAEEALQESEERFRGIFEDSIIGMYRTSSDGRILMANPALVRMLGYSCFEELERRNLEKEGYSPKYPRSAFKERVEVEGRILGLEADWTKKDGTILSIRESARVVRDEQGNTLYYEGTVEDITERKQAEEALKIEKDKLQALMDGINRAGIGIDIIGTDYKVLFQNQTLEEKFGKLNGEPCFEYYKDLGEPCNPCPIVNAVQNNMATESEVRGLDGRDYHVFTAPVPEADGYVNKAIEIILDITERKRVEIALQESRQRLLNLVENMPIVCFTYDREGHILSWNRAAEKIYGYAKNEAIGTNVYDLIVTPGTKDAMDQVIKSVFEGKTIEGSEWQDHDKKKKIGWRIGNSFPLLNANGSVYCGVNMNIDITERKTAEEALKISEQNYRAIVEDQTELICRFLPDSTITFVNEACCRYFDKSCDELIGQKFISYIPEEDHEKVKEHFASLGHNKPVETHEHRIIMPNKEIRWYQWTNRAILDDIGKIVEFQGAGRDITKQKLAEEELRENEKRFRSLSEAAFEGIAITENGVLVDVNKAFTKIYDCSLEELKGKQVIELVSPEHRELVLEKIRSGYDGLYEHKGLRKDGSLIDLEIQGHNVEYQGRTMRLTAIRDITERKQAERRIQEYQAQLKSLASELLLAEERERRRIATGIHDDIAQKLAMAKFSLQTLQASIKDADLSISLEKQCDLMSQVVADARSLTFELGNPVLYQVGLEAAVESYLTERIQKEFGIECKFESEGPKSSLKEDVRIVLFQAVRELLANVIKHANASTIKVYVKNTEGSLTIVVEDNGIGFNPNKIGPKAIGRGGFGLFNIRERLEYFGGNFEIESRANSGTRVTMTVAPMSDVMTE